MPSTTQDLKLETVYSTIRRTYNESKQRWEWWVKFGNEWFVYDAHPSKRMEEDFIGVFDLTGIPIPCVISETPFYGAKTDAGTFTALNQLGGGMRITTGATSGNDNLMTAGDNSGTVYPWNVSRDLFFHAHFRFPNADDLTNTYLLAGLWADADNYICARFDPTGVVHANPNLLYVTRSGGSETRTSLGAPNNNWHEMWCLNTPGKTITVFDRGATIIHTTNVPSSNLTHYCFLETQEDAAKHFDFGHLLVLQDT